MLWARLQEDNAGVLTLNVNTIWRSRDAYKAAYMNIFALTELQKKIAKEISQKMNKPVKVGRYADITNSFHIYGSYFSDFKNFLDTVKNRKWEDRVWTSEFAEPFFEAGRERLAEEKNKK
jgi:thymidylate synthase